MSVQEVYCPSCGGPMLVDDQLGGRSFECPHCRVTVETEAATFLNRDGMKLGPYSLGLLHKMWEAGQLGSNDGVWDEHAQAWRSAREFFEPQPPSPPQPQPAPTADAQGATSGGIRCPFCKELILAGAIKCKHCGSDLEVPQKSDAAAGCLGLLLGPVGLWYKGHWAAGFAWLAMALLIGILTGGWLAPVFWIGMAAHAACAKPKS